MPRAKSNKKQVNSRMDTFMSPAEGGHQFITVVLAIIFSSLISAVVAALLAYCIAAKSFDRPTPVYLVVPPEDITEFIENSATNDDGNSDTSEEIVVNP